MTDTGDLMSTLDIPGPAEVISVGDRLSVNGQLLPPAAPVSEYPAVLVDDEAARQLWGRARECEVATGEMPASFPRLARAVVDLGVPLTETGLLATTATNDPDADPAVLVERVVRPLDRRITLAAAAATLHRVSGSFERELRERLVPLAGVVPPLALVPDASVPEGTVSVRLDALPLGTAPAQPEELLATQVDRVLRRRPERLVAARQLGALLDRLLKESSVGHTVWFAREVLAPERLTAMLRRLLADGGSPTDLPLLLTETLRHAPVGGDDAAHRRAADVAHRAWRWQRYGTGPVVTLAEPLLDRLHGAVASTGWQEYRVPDGPLDPAAFDGPEPLLVPDEIRDLVAALLRHRSGRAVLSRGDLPDGVTPEVVNVLDYQTSPSRQSHASGPDTSSGTATGST